MLAHNMKDILTLVPEAAEFVKKANLEEEFPVDNSDSAAASYLRANYLVKVAGKTVSEDVFALTKKAVDLYGIKDKLDALLPKFNTMQKQANASGPSVPVKVVEASFEGDLTGFGFLSLEKTASCARDLWDQYGEEIKSEEVRRYAGRAWLNKEAAVIGLANRYHATKGKCTEFVKIARLVNDQVKPNDFEAIGNLCQTITALDKKAGLDIIGFNFYKEALITKEAEFVGSCKVMLAGEEVPYEKIQRFGKDRIGATIGDDVAKELTDCPVTNKAVLESLPLDLQRMLKSLVKSN